MEEREAMIEEKVEPIIFEVNETREEFTLEFSRESVKFAERRGFSLSNDENLPMTTLEDLFFYSFRMHHPKVDRTKAEHILYDVLGGFPEEWTERLGKLYALPFDTLINHEDVSANPRVTIKK